MMKLSKGQRCYGLDPDRRWKFFTVQKQLRSDLVLGTDRKRYTQAIPAFDTVADDAHDCIQLGLEIVRLTPESPTHEEAADAFGILNAIGQVAGCKVALWSLLDDAQRQAVKRLGGIAKAV